MLIIELTLASGSTSALVDSVTWIEGVLLGSLGTSLAVLAIGWTGFAMLTGRIDVRRGVQVVLGCFILFGAPLIAKGLIDASGTMLGRTAVQAPPTVTAPVPQQPRQPPQFDPYAGASVPN